MADDSIRPAVVLSKWARDLTGQIFGRLTVLGVSHKIGKVYHWDCLCSCGNRATTPTSYLVTGNTKSCGCKRREGNIDSIRDAQKIRAKLQIKHNREPRRLYRIWSNMKERCRNPKSPIYEWYGGKGVRVCAEWAADFIVFRDWALANGYSDDLSIDRINGNGNYEPGNCRWATRKEQHRNMSSNVILEWNGEQRCIAEWAEVLEVTYSSILHRVERGWSIDRIFTQPFRKRPSSAT